MMGVHMKRLTGKWTASASGGMLVLCVLVRVASIIKLQGRICLCVPEAECWSCVLLANLLCGNNKCMKVNISKGSKTCLAVPWQSQHKQQQ